MGGTHVPPPAAPQLLMSRAKLHELLATVRPDEHLEPAVELVRLPAHLGSSNGTECRRW